ncbi:hypothetical protein U472_08190 [Orenia metallireducens]|uniref:Prepilin-type N-terminal cleavage/methylation domain-containing protein n=1 Tax=Orenia metallireducens TaxID=1413210 RepID=A0A1C0A6X0_9FIRM|nr:prepilin-type N-terminal cleavage/methylation domain-containing protein [Orenia metallireducens]OCL25997.1 hypothetical protein U472_08190 [Orenia metallireducens]
MNNEDGFTLLEVIIAMAILGIGFAILTQGFTEVNDGIEGNSNYNYISIWAESKISELTTKIELNNHGVFFYQNNEYKWWTVEKHLDKDLKELILYIGWQEDGIEKNYSIKRILIVED